MFYISRFFSRDAIHDDRLRVKEEESRSRYSGVYTMGCNASRVVLEADGDTGRARTKEALRSHRGAPPLKVWVRGAGEQAANGTFYRVHPKAARNPKMPACLVVYVNKRGYTLTNCDLDLNMPTFSTRAWTIGRGEYRKKPWLGLFVSLYRRPYKFDKEEKGKSCRPPAQGWVKTLSAHKGGLPAIAYDKKSDKYIRNLTFRINHGLEKPPPGMRGLPARSALPENIVPPGFNIQVGLREEGVSYPGGSDSSSDSSHSSHSSHSDSSSNSSSSDESDGSDSDDGNAENYDGNSGDKENMDNSRSQFDSQRPLADKSKQTKPVVATLTRLRRALAKRVPSFTSIPQPAEHKNGAQAENVESPTNEYESNNMNKETELDDYAQKAVERATGALDAARSSREHMESVLEGSKAHVPEHENMPKDDDVPFDERPIATTEASLEFMTKETEHVEYSRRQNVLFEMEQEKWKKSMVAGPGSSALSESFSSAPPAPASPVRMHAPRSQKQVPRNTLSHDESSYNHSDHRLRAAYGAVLHTEQFGSTRSRAAGMQQMRKTVTSESSFSGDFSAPKNQNIPKNTKSVPHYLQSTVASKHQRIGSDTSGVANRTLQHYPVGPNGLAYLDRKSMLTSQNENARRLALEKERTDARKRRQEFSLHNKKVKQRAVDLQVACLAKGKHATKAQEREAHKASELAERAAHELESLHERERLIEENIMRHKQEAHQRLSAARLKKEKAAKSKKLKLENERRAIEEMEQIKEEKARKQAEKQKEAELRRLSREKAKADADQKMRLAAEAVQEQLTADAESAKRRREKVLAISRGIKESLAATNAFKDVLRDAENRADHEIDLLHEHEHEIEVHMLHKKSESHRRLMEKKRKMHMKRMRNANIKNKKTGVLKSSNDYENRRHTSSVGIGLSAGDENVTP